MKHFHHREILLSFNFVIVGREVFIVKLLIVVASSRQAAPSGGPPRSPEMEMRVSNLDEK